MAALFTFAVVTVPVLVAVVVTEWPRADELDEHYSTAADLLTWQKR